MKEKLEILKELGFGRFPDCDPSYAFGSAPLALDTKMIVRGDHADDCAYIYYAKTKIDSVEVEGLFFAPSILEHPTLNYLTYDFDSVLEEINTHISSEVRYCFVGGIGMIYIEISSYDWELELRYPLSDMLKLIGITDYVLSREFNIRMLK